MRATTRVAAVLLFAMAGCTKLEEPAPTTVVTCETAADCSSGRVCNRNRCILPSELGAPPDLVLANGKLAVSPASGRAGTAFTVTVEATKELEGPPRVILSLDTLVELPCTATGTRTYACSFTATGSERGGQGGHVTIDVRMVDRAGQEAVKNGVGGLDLDFQPPVLAARSVAPASVALGGVLQVFFTTDEDLGPRPVLVASRPLDEPGAGTRFPLTAQPGTRNYLFTHLVTLSDTSGPVTFTAELADPVGNSTVGVPVGSAVLDTVLPVVSALQVSPARIAPTGVVTVSFDATETGALAVTVGGRPMACGGRSASSPNYTCTRTMVGDEITAGTEVPQPVVAAVTDAAGNRGTDGGTIVFDFRPPGVATASVVYAPPAGSPLATVARATVGARVTVSVLADEPLDPAVVPSLVAGLGGNMLSFAYLPAASTSTSVVFEAVVPAGFPDGDALATLTWVDLAGNRGATTNLPAVQLKTSAPTLAVEQGALTFVRSPLGNGASETIGTYTIPAGPYFAVEPSDPLSATSTLPVGALTLDSGLPSAVLVQSSAATDALLLGVLRPDALGRFQRQALARLDVAGVWLVGVDDAANRSSPVQLLTSEWVATPNPPAFGTSPHALLATGFVDPTRAQVALANLSSAAAAGVDGDVVLANAQYAWRDVSWKEWQPAARTSHAMAYDSARGRVVLYGGANAQDTWEWDGSSWTQVATSGPGPRMMHAMAYDSALGQIVLFGGYSSQDGTDRQDTWVWDGKSWAQVAGSGPAPREDHAMAYDWARQRLVLFGGKNGSTYYQDTWEWDGATWTSVATSGPAPRYLHAMVYDGAHGQVILVAGGSNTGTFKDTWLWDGAQWSAVTTSSAGYRSGHAMAYDSGRGQVVLFGGWIGSDQQDTWVWDGSVWTSVASPGPAAREGHAMAFSSQSILFGGYVGSFPVQDTWKWDGARWTLAATQGPSARADPAMAYDSARDRVVLFGGSTGSTVLPDTWIWDGTAWTSVTTPGPSARFRHAMAYDSARGRVVMFGGADASWNRFGDTWIWDGTAWTSVTTPGPSARFHHAMAYDSRRGVVVLFGGQDPYVQADTWEWDGSAWHQSPAYGPPGRYGHAMAYDSARGRTILFGGWGYGGGDGLRDAWEWDGTSWTSIAASGPDARGSTAMDYDSVRLRTVLFGGVGHRGDTWELRAPPGRQPAVQFQASVAPLGVAADRISKVTARAFAGGTFEQSGASSTGVTLFAWSGRGPANEPGGWVALPLATNQVGLAAAPPYLPAAPASLVAWTSASAAEARRYLIDRDGFAFQVRPSGTASVKENGAAVAVDYIEVRVRYTAP